MFRTLFVSSVLLVALLTTGCGEEDKASSPDVSVDHIGWLLDSAPPGAVDVAAVKASAAEGDTVVVRGRIGGRKQPISADSGIFILMDPTLSACSDNPGIRVRPRGITAAKPRRPSPPTPRPYSSATIRENQSRSTVMH